VVAKAPTYRPDAALTDLAGNTMLTTLFTDPTISSF
jgi:hypothetical protein